MPRVSVIIPAFNAESYLRETLLSVQQQTFGDWEAVVVDDASNDNTAALAETFGGRIRVLRSETNGGPAATRNRGLAAAQGELIALLDADDLWLPNYLERMVALYDEGGPRVGVVCCNAFLVDEEGKRLPGTYADLIERPARIDLAALLQGNPIFVSALAPRAVVEQVGGFSEETFGSEDHDLWIKIAERGFSVVATNEPLAQYRVRERSVSANLVGMAKTSATTYRLALERGHLPRRERAIARLSLRLQRAYLVIEEDTARAPGSPRQWASLLRAYAVLAEFALRHPRRWPRWIRGVLSGRAAQWRPPERG